MTAHCEEIDLASGSCCEVHFQLCTRALALVLTSTIVLGFQKAGVINPVASRVIHLHHAGIYPLVLK
jgi:hypothetical protein